MAKRTAIIDLGSNSVRMAVFERTSRFGFHLIKEIKSRVRIGEGAYEQGGKLQETPLNRTLETLTQFYHITQNLNCNKILCVATSALRDAPNAATFTRKVKRTLGLNVRIIEGTTEAHYGAVAAINLLEPFEEATTIDIGGGSTELAKIVKGTIVDTLSLDVGTVRLKELFFDTRQEGAPLDAFLDELMALVPEHFKSPLVIGIGGTLRALSGSIMDKEHYPLETVHGFKYESTLHRDWIAAVARSSILDLKPFGFKKDRLDTIREGCSIFLRLLETLEATTVLTSGAGVREGVFLSDLLRNSNERFPANFNPSIRSLIDRFALMPKEDNYIAACAMKLFDSLDYLHKIDTHYAKALHIAAKLHAIGRSLSFYQEHLHSFYFILNNLNFGFSHEEKMLIALLTKYHSNKLPKYEDLNAYEALLPNIQVVNWLSFILSFAKCLNTDFSKTPVEFVYENHTLHVKSARPMPLAKEAVKKLVKPAPFAIAFR